MNALALVVCALAAYRITRVIAVDDITWRPRQWIATRAPHYVDALVTCPWCVGFWVSGAVLAIAHAVGLLDEPLRLDLLVWWAVAGAQGLLSAVDERLTR